MNFFRKYPLFVITLVIIVIANLLIGFLGGYQYESKKFKTFLVMLIVVLFFQFFFADIICFIGRSLVAACRRGKLKAPKLLETQHVPQHQLTTEEYLKRRLAAYKSELVISEKHRHEKLNVQYKVIASEFCLFAKYFLALLLLIVCAWNDLAYYNTEVINRVLTDHYLSNFSLSKVSRLDDVYPFVGEALVVAFSERKASKIPHPHHSVVREDSWLEFDMTRFVGVVRLKQLRLTKKKIGLKEPTYDSDKFMPDWNTPYLRMHYLDKFWRTYEPWVPRKEDHFISSFSKLQYQGYLHDYPTSYGYVALLARDAHNSLHILKFLKDHKWLDSKTAVVLIDFTLYNVDANIFTVVSIMIEQNPFGGLIWQIDVRSIQLLFNLDQLSFWGWVIFLIYLLVFVQFIKYVFLKIWFYPKRFIRSIWNLVDLFIVLLNLVVFILIIVREILVWDLVLRFQARDAREFVDFHHPAYVHEITQIFLGLLICFVTLRLWKILQFSKVFRIFTRTLFSAACALLSATLLITIFLFGFGVGAYVINGSYTENFIRLITSFTSTMAFSFKFTNNISHEDLSYGGDTLGFILYTLLMFAIAIVFINLFIAVIMDYFSIAKEEASNQKNKVALSFYEFLKVEYAWVWNCCRYICPKRYKRRKRTVTENIDRSLDASGKFKESEAKRVHSETNLQKVEDEPQLSSRLERLELISKIIQTQIELLEIKMNKKGKRPKTEDNEKQD